MGYSESHTGPYYRIVVVVVVAAAHNYLPGALDHPNVPAARGFGLEKMLKNQFNISSNRI
jgi:hypothetical protein